MNKKIYHLKKYFSFFFVAVLLLSFAPSLYGNEHPCGGKADLGVTFMRLELLEYGKRRIKKMDMVGMKGDVTWIIYRGWCLKPMFLLGWGEGELSSVGLGFGRCLPLTENFTILPSVGYTYTHLKTELDIPALGLSDLKNKFDATAPYIGLEAIYSFWKVWRVSGQVQYGWSHSKTKLQYFPSYKDKTRGPNYGLQLERDLNGNWSLNLGLGYNITLSKEKQGLRGKGMKLGLAYWF